MTLELHPLCTLFPRMADDAFEAFKADIGSHGQRDPIVVHEGLILDGGNRYRAITALGIEPLTVEFEGGDPVAFVLSVNLHRRHMTPGQQAAIVASAQDWARAHPAHRPEGGNVAGLSTNASRATQSGASERTQRMADKVARADPDLAKRVAHGDISLPAAVRQLIGPPSEDGDLPDTLEAHDAATSTATAAPANEPTATSGDPDFDAYIEGLHDTIAELRRENEALSATDQGAELLKHRQLLLHAEDTARTATEQLAVREKSLTWFGKRFDDLRRLLGVKTDRDVVGAVRTLTGLKK